MVEIPSKYMEKNTFQKKLPHLLPHTFKLIGKFPYFEKPTGFLSYYQPNALRSNPYGIFQGVGLKSGKIPIFPGTIPSGSPPRMFPQNFRRFPNLRNPIPSNNYFTSSDPHHDMLGGGCQVRVVIENMMGRRENLRTLISGFLGLVILVRWALVTMFLS